MKKIFVQLFFMIFITSSICVFSINEPNDYPLEIITTIKVGSNDGELGFEINDAKPVAKLFPGPLGFMDNGNVIIFDPFNQRVNIYNENFLYLRKIVLNIENKLFYTMYINQMTIDENDNIFIISAGRNRDELVRIENNGKWKILLENYNQFDVFDRYDYFPLGDRILYYDKKEIKFIDLTDGSKTTDLKSGSDMPYIIETKQKNTLVQEEILNTGKLKEFLKNGKVVLRDNRLLSKDFDKHLKYQSFLKTNLKIKRNTPKISLDKKISDPIFLGFDSDDNSYWKGSIGQGIQLFIFNKYEEVIHIIKLNRAGIPVISPVGDIYYLGGDGDLTKVNIYRITRRW